PHKAAAATYFAGLGLGFMFLEVSSIQRFTLYLGYPTYSLTVTLFTLLLSTGAGSFLAEGLVPTRATFARLAGALVVWLGIYPLAVPPVVAWGVGAAFVVRVVTAVVLLAPLGLLLGTFMPLGLRWAAASTPHAQRFVAWCWAVNGFCSVVASVLATMLSMSIGF